MYGGTRRKPKTPSRQVRFYSIYYRDILLLTPFESVKYRGVRGTDADTTTMSVSNPWHLLSMVGAFKCQYTTLRVWGPHNSSRHIQ